MDRVCKLMYVWFCMHVNNLCDSTQRCACVCVCVVVCAHTMLIYATSKKSNLKSRLSKIPGGACFISPLCPSYPGRSPSWWWFHHERQGPSYNDQPGGHQSLLFIYRSWPLTREQRPSMMVCWCFDHENKPSFNHWQIMNNGWLSINGLLKLMVE